MSAICDEGDEMRFMKKEVQITYKSTLILRGKRDSNTGIYLVPNGSSLNPKKS